MKANELMVGDWVQNPLGWKARVMSIKHTCVIKDEWEYLFKIGISKDTFQNNLSESDLSPIPLTTEILEKNGFIRYGTSYFLKESMFELSNPSNPDRYLDNYYIRLARQNKRVMYVHKLQHFMKEFGIEKEIEL